MPTTIRYRPHFKELDVLYRHFQRVSKEMLGIPVCQFFNYSKLFRFLEFHINNVGDPFSSIGHYKTNTLEIEREVVGGFAKLFHAQEDNFWGYVTNGGTEGNFYGLYLARELHPDGIVLYSDQSHYSVPKNIKLLRMDSIKIKSAPNGEIDYQDLQSTLVNLKKTPIIFANIGTTMKGAIDDVAQIKEILSDLNIKKYYIHCDAAFFGMILPFLPEVEVQPFDFRIGIDSIAISGHKMIGTPIPCGVVLVKKEHTQRIGKKVEYLGIVDNTITGSRNGLTPLFLWYELKCAKREKFEQVVRDCIDRAGYAVKKFNERGIKAWRNKNSMIVVFPRPSETLIHKWQLAAEGPIAHIITLPQVTHEVIDHFVSQVAQDLKKHRRTKKRHSKK